MFQSDEFVALEGLSFEQWEKKYILTYLVFIGLFQTLQQFTNEFYLPLIKIYPMGHTHSHSQRKRFLAKIHTYSRIKKVILGDL